MRIARDLLQPHDCRNGIGGLRSSTSPWPGNATGDPETKPQNANRNASATTDRIAGYAPSARRGSAARSVGVWVNAAESILIVATRAPSDSGIDLYFSTGENGVWGPFVKAGKGINSDDHGEVWPRFSADERFFLFNRIGGPNDGIYRIPVTELTDFQ